MSLLALTEKVKTLVGNDSGLDTTFKFVTEEGVVFVDTKQVPNIVSNEDLETECALEITTKNALDLISGDLNPMMGYMMGKFKINGDIQVAMKIAPVFGS